MASERKKSEPEKVEAKQTEKKKEPAKENDAEPKQDKTGDKKDIPSKKSPATTEKKPVEKVSEKKKTEKQYLKDVNIFDIYVNDEKLGKDKKSYAVSFTFQDPEATFTDARIDKIMSNLRAVFEKNLGAQIR